MHTFKKILVPFDGSEHAKRALAKAVSLAQCCDGAKLYIITVDEDVSALSMNNLERAYINEQMKQKLPSLKASKRNISPKPETPAC